MSFNTIPMSTSESFTTIQDYGYTQLLHRLKESIIESSIEQEGEFRSPKTEQIPPISDDETLYSVSSLFADSVHFDLAITPLEHLGNKLVTAVISRLSTGNARLHTLSVAIGVPNMVSVEMTEKLVNGLNNACTLSDAMLQISDVTAVRQHLTLSLHGLGRVDRNRRIKTGDCRPGDQICVTGDLGGAMAGLRVLLREKRAWQESGEGSFQPDLHEYAYVVGRQLLPSPRIDLLSAFDNADLLPTSMVDVSLGIMNELQQLCTANRVGCEIYLPAIPIALETRAVADEMKEDVDRYACYGGEDYEFLFSLRVRDVERLRAEFDDFTIIGEILPESEGIRVRTGEENQQ